MVQRRVPLAIAVVLAAVGCAPTPEGICEQFASCGALDRTGDDLGTCIEVVDAMVGQGADRPGCLEVLAELAAGERCEDVYPGSGGNQIECVGGR